MMFEHQKSEKRPEMSKYFNPRSYGNTFDGMDRFDAWKGLPDEQVMFTDR